MEEPSPAGTSSANINDEDISPVRSKMATLANRSSFASFFLKNKKNIPKFKNDPITGNGEIKQDPSTKMDAVKVLDNVKTESTENTSCDNICKVENVNNEEKVEKEDPLEKQLDEYPKFTLKEDPIMKQEVEDVTIISETAVNESIVISDTDPPGVTVIESDIEIIVPRRSQRIKKSPAADIECISISSDEGNSADRSKVADLRRSNRISGTTPSTPIIPLSDYSNMKKLDFTRPATSQPVLIADSPEKPPVRPITIILKPPQSAAQPKSPTITVNTSITLENLSPPTNINLNVLPATAATNVPPVFSLSIDQNGRVTDLKRPAPAMNRATKAAKTADVEPSTSTVNSVNNINNNINNVPIASANAIVNQTPSVNAPSASANRSVAAPTPQVTTKHTGAINTTPAASSAPVSVPPPKSVTAPVAPVSKITAQGALFPVNDQIPVKSVTTANQTSSARPVTTTVSPKKSAASYIPGNFNELDPSLREELMARLSQRENCNNNNNTAKVTTTNSSSYVTDCEKFVIFTVIQRLIPGTFDESKSPSGKLLPSPSFSFVLKTTDTFGALKRKVAETLRVSPFNLVLTRDHGGAGQSELYDTTRPSTLNITGKTIQEYDQLKVNVRPPMPVVHDPRKKNNLNNDTMATYSSHFSNTLILNTNAVMIQPAGANTNNVLTGPTAAVKNSPMKQVFPPSLTHTLFIYTKSSFSLYKSLQTTKKKQVYDSLAFLQTADQEMSKLSQDPVNKADEDLFESMDMKMSQSQAANSLITINVKTASSRNQSHPIKISSTATIAQLLQTFANEHKIIGTRVIFDGDVLKANDTIGDILEDDDMVEIK